MFFTNVTPPYKKEKTTPKLNLATNPPENLECLKTCLVRKT